MAVAGAAVLVAGAALPATALAPAAGDVRNLKVSKVGKNCVRVKWNPPAKDNGDTYGVIIRTRGGDEMYRVETYKTHTRLCDLNKRTYRVQVKQYGGTWSRGAVRLG
jgi:hypothetical protein